MSETATKTKAPTETTEAHETKRRGPSTHLRVVVPHAEAAMLHERAAAAGESFSSWARRRLLEPEPEPEAEPGVETERDRERRWAIQAVTRAASSHVFELESQRYYGSADELRRAMRIVRGMVEPEPD